MGRAHSETAGFEPKEQRRVSQMQVLPEKLTHESFRALYCDRKPAFELIDGQPEPKALGSRRHAT